MEINITWNICRVCLAEEENKPQMSAVVIEPMRHIFNENKLLAQQIFDFSGIKMEPHDNLPEKICKKCYTSIKHAVSFRKTCRASDTYLQNVLQRTKSASALFKKQQPPLQDPLEEIINSDSLNSDNSEHKDTYLEKSQERVRDSELLEITEIENEDGVIYENDLENNILENNDSCIDEVIYNTKKQGESGDSQIVLHDLELKEENEKELGFLEDDQSETEDYEKNKEEIFTYSEQEDEECLVEINNRDTTPDMESESEARVSSTVAHKDIGNLIEFNMEDSNSSSENNDMEAEYIIDEYLVDDNSGDSMSLKNSSVLIVHSKQEKSVLSKYKKKLSNIAKTKKTKNCSEVWVCDLCGNNFNTRPLLNAHLKVHRQEKSHECEICLKRFITACNLQAHMRTHTGEKPFECKFCGRRFSDRSSNLRHIRTHTNEKPFMCNECGKAFSLSTTLKKHLIVHTGERSFSCDICAKAFKLAHQLKAHQKSTLHRAVQKLTQVNP